MARKAELTAIISADARAYYRTMGKVKKASVDIAKMLAVAGAAGAVFSVREAAQFSKGMAEVNTLAGLGQEEFGKLKDDVRALAVEMGFNLGDVVKALYQAISAGVPPGNAVDFLRTASKGAIAGVSDLTTAVDAGTSILNAYHMEGSQLNDVMATLFAGVKQGKTDMTLLAGAIGAVAPMAAKAGVPIQDLVAALATITKQGIATDEAATQLRGIFNALLDPKLAREMEAVAAAEGEASWQTMGFAKALDGLQKRYGGNDEALRPLFGRIQAFNGFISLTGTNAGTAAESLEVMERRAVLLDAAFGTMMADPSKQFEIAKAQLLDLATAIGMELMPVANDLAKRMNNLLGDPDTMDAIATSVRGLADAMAFIIEGFTKVQTFTKEHRGILGLGWLAEAGARRAQEAYQGQFGSGTASTDEQLAVARELLSLHKERLPQPRK